MVSEVIQNSLDIESRIIKSLFIDSDLDSLDKGINSIRDSKSKVCRVVIKWSAIEPERDQFNKKTIESYGEKLLKLKNNGFEPIVILHNFNNPKWFCDIEGFVNSESIGLFERYTEYVVRNLGDVVSKWITFNNPNTYLYELVRGNNLVYTEKRKNRYFKVVKNIVSSHIKAYKKIGEIALNFGKDSVEVGFAIHISVLTLSRNTFFNRITLKSIDKYYHKFFISGMTQGRLISPLGDGYPYGKGKYCDFVSLSYEKASLTLASFSDFTKTLLFSGFSFLKENNNSELSELDYENIAFIDKKYFNGLDIPIYI